MAHPTITAKILEEKTKAFAPVRASVAWIVSQAASIAESDEAPHSARVQALSLLAKRFPDFREGIQITNNTLNLSGLTDEQLIALSEAISDSKES